MKLPWILKGSSKMQLSVFSLGRSRAPITDNPLCLGKAPGSEHPLPVTFPEDVARLVADHRVILGFLTSIALTVFCKTPWSSGSVGCPGGSRWLCVCSETKQAGSLKGLCSLVIVSMWVAGPRHSCFWWKRPHACRKWMIVKCRVAVDLG